MVILWILNMVQWKSNSNDNYSKRVQSHNLNIWIVRPSTKHTYHYLYTAEDMKVCTRMLWAGLVYIVLWIFIQVYITIATIKFMRNCISKGWKHILETNMMKNMNMSEHISCINVHFIVNYNRFISKWKPYWTRSFCVEKDWGFRWLK